LVAEAFVLVKTDPSIMAGYLEDASGFTQGWAERLVIPENADEVAIYLQTASLGHKPVTLTGGHTGVAAGCIPQGGALMSLERLNHTGAIRPGPGGGVIQVGPAVRLDALKGEAAKSNLIYGPDPTERTATLGGNVSTNASGGQCFFYGTTREHVLGLTGVLSTGESFSVERGQSFAHGDWLSLPLSSGRLLKFQRPDLPKLEVDKNAAGYFSRPDMDVMDLFIGMEGTLAVLTSLQLKLLPAPAGLFTLAIFFPDLDATLASVEAIRLALRQPGGIAPVSLEFMDENSLALIRPAFPGIPAAARAVLIVEQEFTGGQEENRLEQWSGFLASQHVPESMIWFAQTTNDRQRLRDFRHALPETVNTLVRQRKFQKVGTDMAVPVPVFRDMLDIYYRTLRDSGLDYLVFGHIGECHLHVNVLPRTAGEFAAAKQLYLEFARQVVARGGTVSAEHGIGKIKHDFLRIMVGEQGFREMARVKRILDPALILNRGNVFPEVYLEP
jgi:D-lactate dehydrogenase (cytochrome)